MLMMLILVKVMIMMVAFMTIIGSLRYLTTATAAKTSLKKVTSRSMKLKRNHPNSVTIFYVGELSWT